jgi:adenosylmethionine-8-amino-7-oxononanoate aminotransferase
MIRRRCSPTRTRSWRQRRARLGAKLAEIAPGDIDVLFFTNGGAEANENAKQMGAVMTRLMADLCRKHPSVGAARSIELFGLVELVRDQAKKVPMAPFNSTSDEMAALGTFFRQEGLFTFVQWNTFFTNPPLCITEEQLREAFAIINRGLDIADKAVS